MKFIYCDSIYLYFRGSWNLYLLGRLSYIQELFLKFFCCDSFPLFQRFLKFISAVTVIKYSRGSWSLSVVTLYLYFRVSWKLYLLWRLSKIKRFLKICCDSLPLFQRYLKFISAVTVILHSRGSWSLSVVTLYLLFQSFLKIISAVTVILKSRGSLKYVVTLYLYFRGSWKLYIWRDG